MWYWHECNSEKCKIRNGWAAVISACHHFELVQSRSYAGCALFAPREEGPLKQATAEELTALLSQREAAIQTMKGLFSAQVRGGIIPIASRVEGALYYRRPNAMRLRGFTAVGSELFEFVQAEDQFRLRLPTMGRVLSGSPSDMSEMGNLARPFQLSVWAMGGVLGTGRIAKTRRWSSWKRGTAIGWRSSALSQRGEIHAPAAVV